jgi:hypothetical protein
MDISKNRFHLPGLSHNAAPSNGTISETNGEVDPDFPIEVEEIEEHVPGIPRSDKALLRDIFNQKQIHEHQALVELDLATIDFSETQIEDAKNEILVSTGAIPTEEELYAMAIEWLNSMQHVIDARQRLEADLEALAKSNIQDDSETEPAEIDWDNFEISDKEKKAMAATRIEQRLMAKFESEKKEMARSRIIATDEFMMSVAIRRLAIEMYGDRILE